MASNFIEIVSSLFKNNYFKRALVTCPWPGLSIVSWYTKAERASVLSSNMISTQQLRKVDISCEASNDFN
jgi:hypothetical protein